MNIEQIKQTELGQAILKHPQYEEVFVELMHVIDKVGVIARGIPQRGGGVGLDTDDLACSFIFKETPQGHAYWWEVATVIAGEAA